jgi:hypothetical protein
LPTEWICEEIVRALRGYSYGAGPQYIRKCLDKKYKRKYQNKAVEENAPNFVILDKKVPEAKPTTLATMKEADLALLLYKQRLRTASGSNN